MVTYSFHFKSFLFTYHSNIGQHNLMLLGMVEVLIFLSVQHPIFILVAVTPFFLIEQNILFQIGSFPSVVHICETGSHKSSIITSTVRPKHGGYFLEIKLACTVSFSTFSMFSCNVYHSVCKYALTSRVIFTPTSQISESF